VGSGKAKKHTRNNSSCTDQEHIHIHSKERINFEVMLNEFSVSATAGIAKCTWSQLSNSDQHDQIRLQIARSTIPRTVIPPIRILTRLGSSGHGSTGYNSNCN